MESDAVNPYLGPRPATHRNAMRHYAPTSRHRWQLASRSIAISLLCLIALQLLLWLTGINQRVIEHARALVLWPKTGIVLGLLCGAVLFIQFGSQRARRYARLCGALALAMPTLVILQLLCGISLGVDHFLPHYRPDPVTLRPILVHMSTFVALQHIILALSFLLMTARRPRSHIFAQFLLCFVLLMILFPALGFLLSIPPLYTTQDTPLSLGSVAGIIAVSAMILFLRPRSGWMAIATANDPGGAIIRRILPALVLVLLGIAWVVSLYFQRHAGFTPAEEMDLAISCAVNIVILFGIVSWVGRSLHTLDSQRRRTEIQRRHSAIALETSERQYRFLTNSLPQIVWTCAADGKADYFNERWCEYTGKSFADSLARSWLELVHPDDYPRARQAWTRALTRIHKQFEVELRLRRWDGYYRWHLARAVPLEDSSGAIIRWFATCTDIDDQKNVADELRAAHNSLERRVVERTHELAAKTRALEEARRGAEAASHAKSNFLANMSHEIRTPLTAIVGFSNMVQQHPPMQPQELRDALTSIHRNGQHLLQIVNDMLDLSKIEASRLDIESLPCNLPEQIELVMQMFRLRAREKHLQLRLVNLGPLPAHCVTDALRLRQILVNLVGNAVKFTPHGDVTLRIACQPRPQDSKNRELVFEVIDSGIGMSPEEVGRLFQPFTQADSSTTRRFGGTGLGLTISRRLALLLGGDISVRSAPGRGTTFTLWLPVEIPANTPWIEDLASAAADIGRGHRERTAPPLSARILLAEDSEDNQRLLTAILKQAGADVTVVANGKDAMQRALAEPFDLILMDMAMPLMDGYTATRALRDGGCATPILALTAHAMAEDRDRCLAAGCSGYLTKPIDEHRLLSAISKELGQARPASAAPPAPPYAAASAAHSRYADHLVIGALLPQFVKDLQQNISEARELLDAGDLPAFAERMHRIKGAGGAYGYDALTQRALDLETQVKNNAPQHSLQQQFQALTHYTTQIAAALEPIPA